MAAYTVNNDHDPGIARKDLPGSVFYNQRCALLKPVIVADTGILVKGTDEFIMVIPGTKEPGGPSFVQMQASLEALALQLVNVLK